MSDLNQCNFIGRLGADPETRFLPSGGAVTNIRIAVGDKWKDKNTGQQQEHTEWVRVVFFGKLAEIAGEYLNKGSQVFVSGKMVTRKWQGQDGQDKYTTEIKADTMQMLGGRSSEGQNKQAAQDSSPGGGADPDIPFAPLSSKV